MNWIITFTYLYCASIQKTLLIIDNDYINLTHRMFIRDLEKKDDL